MTGAADSTLRLLQITDVHLRAAADDRLLGVDTYASATAVLEQALGERAGVHPRDRARSCGRWSPRAE